MPRLQGDASKFKSITNWEPKINFANLVTEMVAADVFKPQEGNNAEFP